MERKNAKERIRRRQHNKENPYVIIDKSFLRNENISPKTKWFISYLLSFPNDWEFSLPLIRKEQKLGRDLTYSMVNEAIEAGYMEREEYLENGLKRYEYFVSEFPILKKSLPCTPKPLTVEPYPTKYRNIQIEKVNQKDNENFESTKKENATASPSLQNLSSKKKNTFEEVDKNLAELLCQKIKAINPKQKVNLDRWALDFNKIRRLDGYSFEELSEIINKAHNDEFWRKNILSPEKVRKHYTTIKALTNSKKNIIEKNKQLAKSVCHNNKLELTESYVTVAHWSGQSEPPILEFKSENFEEKLKSLCAKYQIDQNGPNLPENEKMLDMATSTLTSIRCSEFGPKKGILDMF